MVGIVLVSHSARLAAGVAELAAGMGGDDVPIEPAGGLDLAESPLGTDAALVLAAIERAWSEDGVLVLVDLGSAVLSAEMALDMLPPERRERVLLSEAPLAEGAVAAAVAARLGAPLARVAEEARGGLAPKAAHLGGEAAGPAPEERPASGADGGEEAVVLAVRNPVGLAARPAARLVHTAAGFEAEITLTNVTTGRGPADARSLNAVATLGVREGHEVRVAARGPQAAEAIAALRELAERSFDEAPTASLPPPAASPPTSAGGGLAGLAASPGLAAGAARHFRPVAPTVPTEPADDPDREWAKLEAALAQVREEIEETRASVAARAGDYEAAIFDAHLLFLEDEALLGPAGRAIREDRRNAADAWRRATDSSASQYRSLDDEYLRARADDLAAVAGRVLAHLDGTRAARPSLGGAGILVAADLSPADTAALDPAVVRGIATAFGGPTSHSAILARALGVPAVVGLGEEILRVAEGTPLLLDGDAGVVVPDPAPEVTADFAARAERAAAVGEAVRARAHEPAITTDGHHVEVAANAGSRHDAEAAVAAGADGIGLLRTEFLFLDREDMPGEDEQAAAYADIAAVLGGRPLVIRTLDVGGDKPLPYLPERAEANPFLGLRGIRLALARPDVLATQLRAVVRVATEHPVRVMFPMVTTLDEVRAAKRLLDEACAGTSASVDVGVMVEVPAAALTAGVLAPEVDFFSIGTNDLTQYTVAAERGNERVAGLADGLHPAVLRLVGEVAAAGAKHGCRVAVCGELAADLAAVPILVGLGVSELSVSPPAVAHTKEVVRALDSSAARAVAEQALAAESAAAVRNLAADRETSVLASPDLARR